jgi:hypothetical protein
MPGISIAGGTSEPAAVDKETQLGARVRCVGCAHLRIEGDNEMMERTADIADQLRRFIADLHGTEWRATVAHRMGPSGVCLRIERPSPVLGCPPQAMEFCRTSFADAAKSARRHICKPMIGVKSPQREWVYTNGLRWFYGDTDKPVPGHLLLRFVLKQRLNVLRLREPESALAEHESIAVL